MKLLPNTTTSSWSSTLPGGKYFISQRRPGKHLSNLTLFVLRSGHCKKLAPEYEAAAAEMAEWDPPMYVAKVDATENKELGERFAI